MYTKLAYIARKTLFILVILITFILFFEHYLIIPVWLQVIGRMHPVLLHFPIVLLLITSGLQFYRFSKGISISKEFITILQQLWLFGAFFTGITVIMGIFLSQEDGFEGDILQQHKWNGVTAFYLSYGIYKWQENNYLKELPVKIMTGLIPLLVLISGHFGAVLTHGENFITAPIQMAQSQKIIPLEEAYAFDDLIEPILKSKCIGCHNPDKIKGELILTDSLSIAKGGKNGALFNFTQPDLSLLLERIHLPLDDKKHMPPKGKPQLTPEEEALLLAWIQAKTPFNKKVIDLTPSTSLYAIAIQRFNTKNSENRTYDFPAADESLLSKLNSDYRTIVPLATNSPALEVAIFNSQDFTSSQLTELEPLKKQIVNLNLSKMPVKDQDLKNIGQFENLRNLNLNFTNITGSGLKELTRLPHLEHLNLAGTKITSDDLKKVVAEFQSIRSITLWESNVNNLEIDELNKSFSTVRFTGDYQNMDTTLLKLNPPQALTNQWVFPENTQVQLIHPVREVKLHYTLDGSEPDSLSPVFTQSILLNSTSAIKVKGYKEGWLPSDITEFQFYRNTFKPDSVQILNRLNHVHLAEGAHTFFDTQLGSLGANNPAWANYFAGVRNENLQLVCRFNKAIQLSSVGIRHMIEEETGIYPPSLVEIWGGSTEDKVRLIAKATPQMPEKKEKSSLKKLDITFPEQEIRYLKIIAKPYQKGDERPKLVLIDEMFLN